MGRVTQLYDYLNRDPKDLTPDFIKANYTHLEITPGLKEKRKKYRKQINRN